MVVRINESNLKQGLLALLVALLEVIIETLERQAIRRIEKGRLSSEEVERLGNAFIELDEALDHIKTENNLQETVRSVRNSLDDVADSTLNRLRWVEEPNEHV